MNNPELFIILPREFGNCRLTSIMALFFEWNDYIIKCAMNKSQEMPGIPRHFLAKWRCRRMAGYVYSILACIQYSWPISLTRLLAKCYFR